MGTPYSKFDSSTPLGCLLRSLGDLGLQQDTKSKRLIFYCNTIWPHYRLDNQSRWPENGTFDFHKQILIIFATAMASGLKSHMSKLSSLFILDPLSLNLATPPSSSSRWPSTPTSSSTPSSHCSDPSHPSSCPLF
jgi:hypothetical protein